MSKRQAESQGGEDRYGPFGGQSQQNEISEQRGQATAAAMARRKIAQPKNRRPRSESPMPTSIFDQANGLMNNNMQPTPNPFGNTSFQFGNTQSNGPATTSFGSNGNSFDFGANNTSSQSASQPKGFTFGSTNNTTPAGSFVFGQQPAQTTQTPQINGSTPSAPFSFGQQNGTSSTPFAFGQDTTPKTATTTSFNFGGTQETPKPQNMFNMAQDSQKPATNLFGTPNATQASNGGPFTFGNTASTNAPKPSTTFAGFGQQKEPETQSGTAAANGWAAFTQQKPSTPAAITNGTSTPTTSFFSNAKETNGAGAQSIFSGLNAQTSKVPTFKFAPQADNAADNDLSMMSPENTPQKPIAPTTNGLGMSASATPQETTTPKPLFSAAKGPSLFDRISKPDNTPDTGSTSQAAAAPSKPLFQPSTTLFTPKPAVSAPSNTNIFSTNQSISAQSAAPPVQSIPTPTSSAVTYDGIRDLNESLLQHLQGQDPNKDWSAIFEYYSVEKRKLSTSESSASTTTATSQTPASKPLFSLGNNTLGQSSAATSLFGQSTTAAQSGTTSTQYPKLPDNASNTAKLFQATLEKNSASAPSLFASKPTTDLPKVGASSVGGFKPTGIASAGSSFLSSFGQQANATAEKEKQKRKDNDYDSDDDNEADWEKKDQEEQAAKRAQLAEAGKTGPGFVFKPPEDATGNGANLFSGFGQSKPTETSAAPSQNTAPSLFNFSKPSTDSSPKLGLFGAPSTPAPATTPGSLFSSIAKPSTTNFSFGQAQTPAAVPDTPAQTNGQQDGEEGDAAPPEPQLEDMAVLLPAELADNEVLYTVEKSKSRKSESRPAEGGGEKSAWVDKGLGPIWILKSKSTGKLRVVQKIKDSGRLAMNFNVMSGSNLYKNEGSGGKAVMGSFVDHVAKESKPSRWAISFGKAEDAKEIARLLQEA